MAQNEITKILSDRLEELTEKKRDIDYRFSDKKQAEQMGIPYPTFLKYKGDKAECPISAIVKMAEYYGVSTEYLLGRTQTKTPNPELEKFLGVMGLSEKAFDNICFITEGGWSANILLESGWLGAFIRILSNLNEWVSKYNYYSKVMLPAINENNTQGSKSAEQEKELLYEEFRYIISSQIGIVNSIEHLEYEYADKIELYEFKLSKVLKSITDEIKAEHRADKEIYELSGKSVYNGLVKRKNDIEKLVQEYESKAKDGNQSIKGMTKAVELCKTQLNTINTILEKLDKKLNYKKGSDENGSNNPKKE